MVIDTSIIFPIGALIGIIFGIITRVSKEQYVLLFTGVLIVLIMQFMDKIERYIPFGFEGILTNAITFLGAFLIGSFVIFVLKCITSGRGM